jgi:hypothetical protein
MTASIAFEQSYSGIDGDSASSTELYATAVGAERRAAPAGLGRDGLGGSIRQRCRRLAARIEKIEGFYRVCKAAGLTGRPGRAGAARQRDAT